MKSGKPSAAEKLRPSKPAITKTVGSVDRAICILNVIAASENGLGVTEISRSLDCGVSATYHLINTLRQGDLLQQDMQTKKYSIGVGLFRLCALAQRQNTLVTIAQPFLDELSTICAETSNLVILQEREAVYVAQSEYNNVVKMFTQLGARVPYYCTAGGKAILSCYPKEKQQAFLRETRFFAFTPRTIVRRVDLMREFVRIRERGYAFDREEREPGVTCVAAPVFDASGEAIAAVSISGPTYRMENKGIDRMVRAVCDSAAALSARLGYVPAGEGELS